MSDLAGTTVTLFLFGDAHKSLYKESEGSVFILYAPKVRVRACSSCVCDSQSVRVSESESVFIMCV